MSALPPAPPGLPATLASAREIPVDQRVGTALLAAVVFVALGVFSVWRGLQWPWAVAVWGITYALVVSSSFAASVNAGKGWLRSGKAYVRTDQLDGLHVRVSMTGTRIWMRDREGRRLVVRLSELTADSSLWELVRSGVRTSLAAGLAADAGARRLFE